MKETHNSQPASFLSAFYNPSDKNGEVPFYWWTGDRLNKERLRSQLTMLKEKGVAGVQVNYAHMYNSEETGLTYGGAGRSIPGDPVQFSEEWWEFFGYAAEVCEELGMGIGVGDYTLAWIGNGFFTDKVANTPGMSADELSCEKIRFDGKDGYTPAPDVLALVVYKDLECSEPVIVYEKDRGFCDDIPFCVEAYEIKTRHIPLSINPLAPGCGEMLTDIYFREFENRFPNLKNGTLNYFFQDELLFGCDIRNIWHETLREGVKNKKGYDPLGFIPHMFFLLGDITAKIRLDIADVKTGIAEDNYFKPIYDFHASRGLIYGCDQSSRGFRPDEFSDYFRTVRWFTAPGNDTPGRAADLIKVKVNSSIAHLYNRPRVWLEGYHSSGWGTTLESITAPTSDNFLFGANLLNLHGLYYSTNGGFFEWAPPDFHFRMPYWDDEKTWLDKYRRLSTMLTTGSHRCDAAIFYPVSSCDYGENGKKCTDSTFDTACTLFYHGVDFDFVDFQSIENANFENGTMNISDESYRALIFCNVDCIRYSIIEKIKAFLDCGGYVYFCGITPYISDRAGANDDILRQDIKTILSYPHARLCLDEKDLLKDFDSHVYRSFLPEYFSEKDRIYVNRRVSGGDSLYFVRYAPKDSVCRFEATGKPYLLDIYNKKIYALLGTVSKDGFVFIKMPKEPDFDTIILFTENEVTVDDDINTCGFEEKTALRQTQINEWDFELIPTLDNKYGDFYLPAGGIIGAEGRFFDVSNTDTLTADPEYDFKALPYCVSNAVYRYRNDVTPGAFADILADKTDKADFEPLKTHDRYGYIYTGEDGDIYRYDQGWHGLKGKIYDDNIYFDSDSVFVTAVYAENECDAILKLGAITPDSLFINGIKIDDYSGKIHLNKGANKVIAAFVYDENKAPNFRNNSKLKFTEINFIRTEKTERTEYPLSCASFANDNYLTLCSPFESGDTYRFDFDTPPGFSGMEISLFGTPIKIISGKKELHFEHIGKGLFNSDLYTVSNDGVSLCGEKISMLIKAKNNRSYCSLIPTPIKFFCEKGKIKSGDTSKTGGLTSYSGKMKYSAKFNVIKENTDEHFELDLGHVGCTASVRINGSEPIVFTYAPFKCDITALLKNCENEIEITVSNTLCNHYSTIPSRYSNFPEDAASGLLDAVTITAYR